MQLTPKNELLFPMFVSDADHAPKPLTIAVSVVCLPPDDTAMLCVEHVLEVVGIEPGVQHFVAVSTNADVENLVAVRRKARNRGRVEHAFVAFDSRLDRREQPVAIVVQKGEEVPALCGKLRTLASAAHQRLMLDCLNSAAGRLRCDLVLSVIFHVILGIGCHA